MNKYQKALRNLALLAQTNPIISKSAFQEEKMSNMINNFIKVTDSLVIIKELVDKSAPMKVDLSTKRLEDYTGEDCYFRPYYDCPKCEEEIEKDVIYCPYCGQALDWSKDE